MKTKVKVIISKTNPDDKSTTIEQDIKAWLGANGNVKIKHISQVWAEGNTYRIYTTILYE